MKFLNRHLVKVYALALFATVLAACTTNVKDQAGQDGSIHPEKPEVTEAKFKDSKIAAVYTHYLHVKNALVLSDSRDAQLGSSALKTALVDAGNSKGAELAEKITQASNLKTQRAEFDALTKEIESLVRKSTLLSGEVYKQYCPMANEGNGGYWLSNDPKIKNPYYGDEMLECGEVKEVIK